MIDSWNSFSERVNHISDRAFDFIPQFGISTGKSMLWEFLRCLCVDNFSDFRRKIRQFSCFLLYKSCIIRFPKKMNLDLVKCFVSVCESSIYHYKTLNFQGCSKLVLFLSWLRNFYAVFALASQFNFPSY